MKLSRPLRVVPININVTSAVSLNMLYPKYSHYISMSHINVEYATQIFKNKFAPNFRTITYSFPSYCVSINIAYLLHFYLGFRYSIENGKKWHKIFYLLLFMHVLCNFFWLECFFFVIISIFKSSLGIMLQIFICIKICCFACTSVHGKQKIFMQINNCKSGNKL